jgi:hypothetical protein
VARLEQFALDAAVPPPGVLTGQAKDECMELAPGNRSLPVRASPVGGPFAADELAMPTEHRLGTGQERSPGRPGQGTADRGKQETVGGLPARPAGLSLKHPKLMAEGQHLGTEPRIRPAADDQDLQ